MTRQKNRTKKNDDSYSRNAVKNERLSEHERDLNLLAKVKKSRKGKKFITKKISSTPNTWIEIEVKN